MKMITVTKKHPCPICKKPDWCGVSADGNIAICMRIQSNKPTNNGGYLHILKERPKNYQYRPALIVKEEKKPTIDSNALIFKWRNQTKPGQIEKLADDLGVSSLALQRLDAVWAQEHNAWAFPMRNEHSRIIGIRLRNNSGFKWAVKGSNAGLFIPAGLRSRQLLIVEGPTDTAAGLTLGFDTIGRQSCVGQEDLVCKWLNNKRYDEIILLIDHDKLNPVTGKYPGYEGAKN